MTEGSLWVEDNKLCYVDSSGEKQCIPAQQFEDSIGDNEGTIQKILSEGEPELVPQLEFVYSQDDGSGDSEVFASGSVYNNGESGLNPLALTIDGETETSDSFFVLSDQSKDVLFEGLSSGIDSSKVCFVTDSGGDCIDSVSVDPKIDVTITGTNSPVTAGNTLDVNVDLENKGISSTTQTISLVVGNSQRDSQSISLSSGGTSSITLSWNTTDPDDVGTYTALVESETDSDSETVIVEDTGENFDVTIADTNSPVESGEKLDVDAEIENTGSGSASQDITLEIDSTQEDIENNFFVAEGKTESLTLTWDVPDAQSDGDYTAKVSSSDTSDTQTVTVSSTANDSFFDVTIDSFSVGDDVDVQIGFNHVGNIVDNFDDLKIVTNPEDEDQVTFEAGRDLAFKYRVLNKGHTSFNILQNPDQLYVDNTVVDEIFAFDIGDDFYLDFGEDYSGFLRWNDISEGDYDVTVQKGNYSSDVANIVVGVSPDDGNVLVRCYRDKGNQTDEHLATAEVPYSVPSTEDEISMQAGAGSDGAEDSIFDITSIPNDSWDFGNASDYEDPNQVSVSNATKASHQHRDDASLANSTNDTSADAPSLGSDLDFGIDFSNDSSSNKSISGLGWGGQVGTTTDIRDHSISIQIGQPGEFNTTDSSMRLHTDDAEETVSLGTTSKYSDVIDAGDAFFFEVRFG